MLKEKTKYQRILLKKTDEMKNMFEEVKRTLIHVEVYICIIFL